MNDNEKLLHQEITGHTIKTFFEVHTELHGIGYLENVYKRATVIALRDNACNATSKCP